MFNRSSVGLDTQEVQVSSNMAKAINAWFNLFYVEQTASKKPGEAHTKFAVVLTNYAATLATNEILLSTGTGARADYILDQITRFVLPGLRVNVQLAGVGGEIILKPFVSNSCIMLEAITADRFYPTRINGAGIVEAGFFTDFDSLNGKPVVRVEHFDLQADGLYITNKAYYERVDGVGADIPLSSVYRWADLAPDIKVSGVDRPLFARLKMPFANTIDNTSQLPVSLYANSIDAISELDRIYSEFLHEMHTGKRKQIIDQMALAPYKGKIPIPVTDLTSDAYLILNLGDNWEPFKDYTPEMRVDAYQKAIDMQLRIIEMQCGFSTGTFTLDVRTGKVTATQIISEDKDTYNTIKAIQDSGMAQGLKDLIYVYDVLATAYKLAPSGAIEPSVSFGDSIFEDTAVEYSRRKQMTDSGYLKPEKLISWYFGISEEEAREEYIPAPEPEPIFGGV